MKLLPRKFSLKHRHRELLSLIWENKARLLLAMVCMILMSGSMATVAYLVEPAMDKIFVNRQAAALTLIPLVVVIVFFIRGASYYGQEYLMGWVGENIIRRLRDMLYGRMMDLPLSFFQGEKTGELMSRITWDVNVIRAMVTTAVTSSLRDFFSIVFLTGVIFYQDWVMAIFALVILPAAFYPIYYFGRKVRRLSTGVQEAMGDMNSHLQETFTGNKVVRAFGMEEKEKDRFYKKTADLFSLSVRQVRAKAITSPIMEFLGGVGIAGVIWYGGYLVFQGDKTPGQFFSFMAAVLMLYDPVKKLSRLNAAVQEGLAAWDRIFDIVETESEIKEKENPCQLAPGTHTVKFENVSFAYGDTLVLKDINLQVDPGEVVALVGASGGGKTSLVNLIPRFYDVTAGSVKIDGVDVRDYSLSSLRAEIAIVTQEPILFNDTVRNNIAYGNEKATEEEIMEAARAAYAHEFITRLPKGYDSVVGELGGRLSGGEKQRLCIARALLKDAPILILDEATSSLDTQSERVVQKALENLMAGRTSFVIAHRLSTIRHADRILVVQGGEIVEQGDHRTLMAADGLYARLCRMQDSAPAEPGGKTVAAD
ncbi:MAG: lipid A export permease/ATP-binding protein MsbA [Deltaproteobacteria bacterium]|nr:lipid A export permease/ATP-binding protein MsbA [Deltaproteobacteria bacterium]